MTMTQLSETCKRLRAVLFAVGREEVSTDEGYQQLNSFLHSFAEDNDFEMTPAGYLQAAECLRDHAFPNWPFAGMPYDPTTLRKNEDETRSVARGIGVYLSVAIEELDGVEKMGAEAMDEFLESSGLLTLDVRE